MARYKIVITPSNLHHVDELEGITLLDTKTNKCIDLWDLLEYNKNEITFDRLSQLFGKKYQKMIEKYFEY